MFKKINKAYKQYFPWFVDFWYYIVVILVMILGIIFFV